VRPGGEGGCPGPVGYQRTEPSIIADHLVISAVSGALLAVVLGRGRASSCARASGKFDGAAPSADQVLRSGQRLQLDDVFPVRPLAGPVPNALASTRMRPAGPPGRPRNCQIVRSTPARVLSDEPMARTNSEIAPAACSAYGSIVPRLTPSRVAKASTNASARGPNSPDRRPGASAYLPPVGYPRREV
jgi:hypothetical protein